MAEEDMYPWALMQKPAIRPYDVDWSRVSTFGRMAPQYEQLPESTNVEDRRLDPILEQLLVGPRAHFNDFMENVKALLTHPLTRRSEAGGVVILPESGRLSEEAGFSNIGKRP